LQPQPRETLVLPSCLFGRSDAGQEDLLVLAVVHFDGESITVDDFGHRSGEILFFSGDLRSARLPVLPDAKSRSLGFLFGRSETFNSRLHECNRPIDAMRKTLFQQSFGDVSLGMDDGTDKIVIVNGFENDVDFPLQQTDFNEIASLFGVRNFNSRIGLTIGVQLESGTLQSISEIAIPQRP
jgi:hypothetical protein